MWHSLNFIWVNEIMFSQLTAPASLETPLPPWASRRARCFGVAFVSLVSFGPRPQHEGSTDAFSKEGRDFLMPEKSGPEITPQEFPRLTMGILEAQHPTRPQTAPSFPHVFFRNGENGLPTFSGRSSSPQNGGWELPGLPIYMWIVRI